MPEKSRSQCRENEDGDYRIQSVVALNRSVSKESDQLDESDSSESLSETTCSNKSNSFRVSEKHEDSVSAPESGCGDATDHILPDGTKVNETDHSRDDTQIKEWTAAKQALVKLINETLRDDPVLRSRIIAELDPINNPQDFVAILEHPPSKCDLLPELTNIGTKVANDSASDRQRQPDDVAKSERKKRRSKWTSRGMSATARDSDESNTSSDESLSDSESTKNAGKYIQSIVQGEKTSKMTETISFGSSTVLASGPTTGNAKGLQSLLVGMKELNIDLHMDKSNLVPMNDLDGKNNAVPNIGTPVREKNLSVRNEFDDTSSKDDDDDGDDDDDDDDSSSDISIDVNASDESDDENYDTRGGGFAPYSTSRPVVRDKNMLVKHEYTSTNVKAVNKPTWNGAAQTKLYVPPGLVTPPSRVEDVDYLSGASMYQMNNAPFIPKAYYPYSPESISEDHPDLSDACQSASNNGWVQNYGPVQALQSELEELYLSSPVTVYHEVESSRNTASVSQSQSVRSSDNVCDPMNNFSVEINNLEHNGNAYPEDIQRIIMDALKKLTVDQQITLLSSHRADSSMIGQILADLQSHPDEKNAADHVVDGKASQSKVRECTDPARRPNRNSLTVKQIIDGKLQVSIDKKIMKRMKANKLLAKMSQVFELDDQVLMPANNETVLMRLLDDSQNFEKNIELFVVLIERMTRIPLSFNNRDKVNKSALYLAAINFPTMPEIVGHLAKIMLESDPQSKSESETTRQLKETIAEVLSKGDAYIEVLKELLNLERSGAKIFDVNSYISPEGKTMLQIAREVNQRVAGSAVLTIDLLVRNARPTACNYNAWLNNGITWQSSDILSDLLDIETGVTEEYVLRTQDTFGIAMISDQFVNRPIMMQN